MTDRLADAWALLELRRLSEADALIRAELSEAPNNPDSYHAGAYLAYLQDEHQAGLAYTEQGLSLAPDHTGVLYLRFLLLQETQAYAQAELIIIDLLKQAPADSDYLCAYAELMLKTLHIDKARALCNEALRVDPDSQLAKTLSYQLDVIDGESDSANTELAQLVRDNPESRQTLALIAQNLVEQHRYREAERVAAELIRLDPSEPAFIELAIELRKLTHWTSIPNWPFNRFGWAFSVGVWLVLIVFIQIVIRLDLDVPYLLEFLLGYLAWVAYSWVQPPLLKKWLQWRGL